MNHESPTSRKHHSLHIIALCAVVVVAGSLLIIDRLQKRLVEAERRAFMLQERVTMMKTVMQYQGKQLEKARQNVVRKDGASENGGRVQEASTPLVRKSP